jgi:peptidyl-prolyl cis-trans isomerase SurA
MRAATISTIGFRLVALTFALFVLGTNTASAQVAVLVNGEPITNLDIAQRTRLIQISQHRTATRQEALNELIDDKLKLQNARRYRLEIPNSEIEGAFANMAKRSRLSSEQFTQELAKAGIEANAIKERIRVDIGWSQIIRGKFQQNLQVGERDVMAALQSKNDAVKTVSYDYALRPILLIVPRGSPESSFAARQRDAEALRTRFESCDAGIPMARAMHDVAVRAQITRSSGDLAPQLREVLDKTPIGRLTPPEITAQGVEVFAVCAKKESGEDSPGKREMRENMVQQRYQAESKRYLEELRRGAMIEYR